MVKAKHFNGKWEGTTLFFTTTTMAISQNWLAYINYNTLLANFAMQDVKSFVSKYIMATVPKIM